ncbi:hypothetical protein SUGI_0393810 [Cryptomeria japonica]|nr:hypothetical protein SUGI_0393810 [Cryptomeria japonica]
MLYFVKSENFKPTNAFTVPRWSTLFCFFADRCWPASQQVVTVGKQAGETLYFGICLVASLSQLHSKRKLPSSKAPAPPRHKERLST